MTITIEYAGQKDEVIEDVVDWDINGDFLLLHFKDGSARGIREFLGFTTGAE